MSGEAAAAPPSLRRFCGYFLKLGALGFGGPIALAGAMQRDLVEERRWVTREDYAEGLALAQLAPGPLAAQLAIYLGWIHGRILGATLVGIAFVFPSFLMVLGLSALYVAWGGLRPIQAVFYGVGAAVVGIIVRSAAKLARTTLGRDLLAWLLFGVSALTTALLGREILWVVLLSGVVTVAARSRPAFTAAAVAPALLVEVFLFFAKAGSFVFGSGLAIVPFLHGGVVLDRHWLTEQQFLDAVAVAMITPGPVVITVAFIGYLVAGPAGATAAALGVFLPVWLFVVIPARWFRRHGSGPRLKAFVLGVTSAAVGAIAGAAFVIARGAVRDVPTALVAVGALLAVWRLKVPEPPVVLAAALIGLAAYRG